MKESSSALITGAASGIGRATAERLLRAGWNVLAADFNAAAGEAFVADWTDRSPSERGRVAFARVDVSQEADVEGAVCRAVETFGGLDCVVNNAGVGGAFGPITDITVEDWDYTFAVLVRGVFLGTKHGAHAMQAAGRGGAIVNVASIAGLIGGLGPQAYSAAKAAVINFGRVTAIELAQHRIRVNTVSPGIIRTPLAESGKRDLESAMKGIQPWPDLGSPDDVAAVIAFLASEEARFITGENVTVDGGLMAGGPRLGDTIGGNPALRGLAGVNRGSTGLGHTSHRVR